MHRSRSGSKARSSRCCPAPQLAIVGSRNPTIGGSDTAEQFARYLSQRGLTITSGLATGIDAASHRGALRELGGTVAVLGGGLDAFFRASRATLGRDRERGLLVSEYAPGIEPQKHSLSAAQSHHRGAVVRHARRRGDATQRLVDHGEARDGIRPRGVRDPGLDSQPARARLPLADSAGREARRGSGRHPRRARSATRRSRSHAAAPPAPERRGRDARRERSGYRNLLKALDFSPLSIADLSARAELTTAELSSMLLMLELEGFVEALPGGRYSRSGQEEMMKESVLDVLMYLFESLSNPKTSRNPIATSLNRARARWLSATAKSIERSTGSTA